MPDKQSDLAIIIDAVNNASKKMKQVQKDLDGMSKAVKEQDQAAEQASVGFGKLVAGVAMGTVAAQFAVGAFRKLASVMIDIPKVMFDMAKGASEVEGLGIAMHIVANNAGIAAEAVDKVRDSVVEQNVTTEVANRLLTDLIRNQLDYTQATELATAAQDLAVASGVSSSETVERISNAISSGNTWLLRQLGLTQHLDETYENYAATLGKTSEELTVMERKQAVVNYVLQEGTKYAGAYDAAMGNAAKKMRSTQDKMKELSYTVGKVFNNALYKVVDTVYSFVDSIVDFAHENSDKLMAIGQSVTAWVEKVINNIRSFFDRNKDVIYKAVNFIIGAFQRWISAMSMVVNVIQGVGNVVEAFARSVVQAGKVIYNAIIGNWEAVAKEGDIWLDRMGQIGDAYIQNVYDGYGAIKTYRDSYKFDLKKWWDSIEGIEGDAWEDRLREQEEELNKMSAQQQKAYKKMLKDIEKENRKYTKAIEKRVKSFEESFDDLVLSHRDAIQNITEDLKEENKDYKENIKDMLADYNEAMETIEDRHEEKSLSVMEDMEDERKKAEEEIEKITEKYNEERTLIEREGEARLSNLKAQLAKEVALGDNANKEKIDALEKMIAYEEKGLSNALDDKKDKYDEEVSDIDEKLNDKLDKLQRELDKEDTLLTEAMAKRKSQYDEDLADAKESYEEKRLALQEELNEETAIREKYADDFERLANKIAEDDLTRLVRKHNEELEEMELDHKERLAEIKSNAFEQGVGFADSFASGMEAGYPAIKSKINQVKGDLASLARQYEDYERMVSWMPGIARWKPVKFFTWVGGGGGGGGGGGAWQKGGLAMQPGIVGEAGAEIVLPLNFPKRMAQIMQAMGMGGRGGQEVVQNFYVTVQSSQDVDVLMERAGFALKNQGGL